MSVHWEPRDDQPDRPVISGRVWRGVINALLIEACVIFILACGYIGWRLS